MSKFSEIRRILILILAFNWLVASSKIIYGIITRCASMTADGFHSFGDGASNIIGLVGIWVASKPIDDSHPYGHRKFETFATLGIAVILFIASFEIFKDAIQRFIHPVVPDVTLLSFGIMIVTMMVNLFVMRYEHSKGERLSSDILVCDSLHTRSDIYASLIVVVTLVSIKLGFPIVDTLVATFIAILIAKSGVEILRTSSNVLCDASALANARVKDIVDEIPAVRSVHNIRTRGRMDDIHVDLHVSIDSRMSVDDAHKLSHQIESILKDKIRGVTDVIVHIEPSKK